MRRDLAARVSGLSREDQNLVMQVVDAMLRGRAPAFQQELPQPDGRLGAGSQSVPRNQQQG